MRCKTIIPLCDIYQRYRKIFLCFLNTYYSIILNDKAQRVHTVRRRRLRILLSPSNWSHKCARVISSDDIDISAMSQGDTAGSFSRYVSRTTSRRPATCSRSSPVVTSFQTWRRPEGAHVRYVNAGMRLASMQASHLSSRSLDTCCEGCNPH